MENSKIPDFSEVSSYRVGEISDDTGTNLVGIMSEERCGERVSIKLPWKQINRFVGNGLRMGQVTILAGVVGSGKTHATLAVVLQGIIQGIRWQYLPLEDSAESALRHAVAIDANDWGLLSENQKDAMDRMMHLKEKSDLVVTLTKGICKNPNTPLSDGMGGYFIPSLYYKAVVDWVNRVADNVQLLIVDPLSMIEYTNERTYQQWKGQQDFIKNMVAVAAARNCHILLVAHLSKDRSRPGRPLNLDDVEGSAGYSRFAHNVLLLDRHEETEHEVFSEVLLSDQTITHKRTLTIGKARYGPGTGIRIAMDFDAKGPKFMEHGVIKPKK